MPRAARWGRNLLDPWVTPSWSWRRQFSFSVYKTFAFSAALHLLPTLPRQQDAQLCPHSPLLPLAGDLFPFPPRWLLGPPSQDTATTGTPSPAPSSARGPTELSQRRRGCRLRCWESRSAITQIKSHWLSPAPLPQHHFDVSVLRAQTSALPFTYSCAPKSVPCSIGMSRLGLG